MNAMPKIHMASVETTQEERNAEVEWNYVSPLIARSLAPSEEDPEPIEPVMELLFLKDSDGKFNLSASLVNYVNRQPVPLAGLEVAFYAGEESPLSLGRVLTDNEGMAVTSCWKLSESEIMRVQETGIIYLQILTFGNPLQPVMLSTELPLIKAEKGDLEDAKKDIDSCRHG